MLHLLAMCTCLKPDKDKETLCNFHFITIQFAAGVELHFLILRQAAALGDLEQQGVRVNLPWICPKARQML